MYSNYIKSGILILLAGWLVASCTAVPNPEDDSFEGIIISASLDDEETRTSLAETGEGAERHYEVRWKTGDKISVNGNLSNAVASTDNNKKSVDFTVSGSISAPYKVLYPGTSSTDVITLPATQNYVADSFDGAAAASFGTATRTADNKYTAKLTHFCGVLRFALKGTATLDRIVINSLGDEMLSGPFELTVGQGGFTGGFDAGSSASKSVTLSFGSGLTLNSGSDTPIYVAIPAQEYASGLEALVYQSDGAFMRLKFWGDGETLGRDDIVEFESKTFAAGRTENLFSIGSLTAEDGGEPTATPPGITVATFNTMRFKEENRPAEAVVADNSKAKNRPANAIIPSCTEMRAAFGQVIYNAAADIIGFNEIGDDMYKSGKANSVQDLATAAGCTGYTFKFYSSSDNGTSYHYGHGFAYKSSILTLEDSGRIWLYAENTSPYYSTYSESHSGSPVTNCVWAKFTHNVSGRVFWFFVTQLHTKAHGGNLYSSMGMNAFASYKAGSARQILVGDMNSVDVDVYKDGELIDCQQECAKELKKYWTDAYETIYTAHQTAGDLDDWFYYKYPGTQSGTGKNYQYSILDFCKNHPERRIDHIMTRNCTATSYRTVRLTYSFGSGDNEVECYPSDHLAIVSYITLD